MTWASTRYPGIQVRHRKNCPAPEGRCRCQPSYRARDGRRPWSPVQATIDAARNWQTDARNARKPEAQASRVGPTFATLAERFLDGAEAGTIAQRNGEPYRPATIYAYRHVLTLRVLPSYGLRAADTLTALDWQLLVDEWHRHGLKRNTIEATFNAVRAIYRWACSPSRRLLPANETRGVELPARDETRRDRIVPPDEARRLLGALTDPLARVHFGLALYAGLRNVECRPLQWEWVDFGAGRIEVRVSKSKAGLRTLPIIARLRPILTREWMRQGQPATGSVVLAKIGQDKYRERCDDDWMDAGLNRITPHEGRHTFASYLIASGLNAKAVTVLMGHESVATTFDRYGKLFPGHEDEAAGLLDAFLGVPDTETEEAVAGG